MKAAVYHYGEFKEVETISKKDFENMEELEAQALLGFDLRKEDRGKKFYADPDYIDAGADGISVKYAYAIKAKGKIIA